MFHYLHISAAKIMDSNEGDYSYTVKSHVLNNGGLDTEDEGYAADLKEYIATLIDDGKVTLNQMFLIMYEQGIITATENQLANMKGGGVSTLSFIVEKLKSKEITPRMTNLEPCTGSVVVECVRTGEVLAAVAYPSYDNNRFVNVFDNDYFRKINGDPTAPEMVL